MKSPCFISHFFLFSLLELFSPIVLLLDLKNHQFVIFVICNPLIRKKIIRFVLEDCYLHFVNVIMKMMANTHLDSLFLHLSMRTSQICNILSPSLLNNRRHVSPLEPCGGLASLDHDSDESGGRCHLPCLPYGLYCCVWKNSPQRCSLVSKHPHGMVDNVK